MQRWVIMLIGTITVTVSAAEPKASPASFKDKFFRSWLAIEKIEDGKSVTDPEQLGGRQFGKDSHLGWPRRGELSSGSPGVGPQIDSTAEPMRVNFINQEMLGKNGEAVTRVLPCIFKYEKSNLVIAFGKRWIDERKLKAGEDYEGRPTDFKSTKENGLRIEIMKPCAYLDQD